MNTQKVGFISVSELIGATEAGGTDIQLVDARTRDEFVQAHIPGAVLLEWEDWCEAAPPSAGAQIAQPGYWGKLADPLQCEAARRLSQCGLNSSSPIVVYADGIPSKGRDGRAAWMLLYFGAAQVFLLNGGWAAWCGAGGVTTAEGTIVQPGIFALCRRDERRITLDQLTAELAGGGVSLIDTRCVAEYVGDCYDYQPRKGHLPNSVLFPFQDYYESDGNSFATGQNYRAKLARAGHELDGGNLVSYCEVGVRAGTMALLHEIYTGQIVRVYDGSILEWSHHRDLPMEASGLYCVKPDANCGDKDAIV